MSSTVTNPFIAAKQRPLVVGHRGVPALHQENTLAGFRRAVALGVPAVELDARLTADGVAVVLHDGDVDRLTEGTGNVIDMTWDRLSKLRIRRELPMGIDAHGAPVIARYERTEPIPLLAEVLAEVAGTIAINIELKLDYSHWWQTDVGTVVAQLIADAHVADRVIVTSFDPRKLRAAARVQPALAYGFCFDDSMLNFARPLLDRLPGMRAELDPTDRRPGANARQLLNWLLDGNHVGRLLGTQVVGAEHTLVGGDTVRRLHERGIAIGTHTLFPIGSTTGKPISANAVATTEVERLVALGVDWIETDDPERLLELIG